MKIDSMCTGITKLVREAEERQQLEGAYRSGLAWAITNSGCHDALTVYQYCEDIVERDEYEFNDPIFTTMRKLIELMVGDVKVFKPSSENGMYEIAFATGVADGGSLPRTTNSRYDTPLGHPQQNGL